MANLDKYWKLVRKIEATLPPGDAVHIVSKENETTGTVGGKVSLATREYAARWIAQGSHDVATEDQIEAYRAELKARTDASHKAELEKKQTVRLETAIPQEQLDAAVAKAIEAQGAAKSERKR
jgi:hypothetical protein